MENMEYILTTRIGELQELLARIDASFETVKSSRNFDEYMRNSLSAALTSARSHRMTELNEVMEQLRQIRKA